MIFKIIILIVNFSLIASQDSVYYPSSKLQASEPYCDNKFSFKRSADSAASNITLNAYYEPRFQNVSNKTKRGSDSVFHGHPKTREEMWYLAFQGRKTSFDQVPSLINLVHMLAAKHMNECVPIILYDVSLESHEGLLLQQLMRSFPIAYVHGKIGKNASIVENIILRTIEQRCVSYILFMEDVMKAGQVLGLQAWSKVVVIARSSQWRVQEFLYSKASRNFINLLVVAQSFRDDDTLETPYILYTHSLFIDGLGMSRPEVLTSWARGRLARPQVSLFPAKMTKGYAGHRFSVVAANQPPFVFKRIYTDVLGNRRVSWEGVEYRLLNLLGHRNNFSIEIKEPKDLTPGASDAVGKEVTLGHADIGMGGLYVTVDSLKTMDMSSSHSQDCAVFISLTSTALPRYRAIMGPFHWSVWVALTFTYLFGIIPLAFSDKHTLRHLIHNSGEIENMFWYVFGTFTNCFTFVGKNSWSKTTKITTRLLIGWYWIFTIIITACYTGSIIAFVTLPVYPATVDSVQQLLAGNYRVGTLDRGGWESWFLNSSDKATSRLLRHLELVPTMEAGLLNTTRAFFWSYAFLGSRYQLEHVVQSNFTLESSKRSVLHISDECFVPFGVSLAFPKESVYTEKLSSGILRMQQSGIISKLQGDVKWDMQRSSTGKLLQASSSGKLRSVTAEERGLSLSDTQGMFLLLGAGCLAAGAALLSEWLGGCRRMCRRRRSSSTLSTDTQASSNSGIAPTPNSKPVTDEDVDDAEKSQQDMNVSSIGGVYRDMVKISIDEFVDQPFSDEDMVDMEKLKNAGSKLHEDVKVSSIGSMYKGAVEIDVDEFEDNKRQVTNLEGNVEGSLEENAVDLEGKHAEHNLIQVTADVFVGNELMVTKEGTLGHSRRSSSVDWDSEIDLMCRRLSKSDSDEEQFLIRPEIVIIEVDDETDALIDEIVTEQNDEKGDVRDERRANDDVVNRMTNKLLGEVIAPIDVDDRKSVIDEEKSNNCKIQFSE